MNPFAPIVAKIRKFFASVQAGYRWLMVAPPAEVMLSALPFQGPLETITAAPPPRFMRGTLYTVVAMFVTLLVIGGLVPVDMVVVASGRITPDAPAIVLQPIERGIIRELNVKAGDVVTKGQILATLDPTFAQADMDNLSMQQRSLLGQIRRIEAELQNRDFVVHKVMDRDDELQLSLYRQRRDLYMSKLQSLDEAVKHQEVEIRATQSNIESLTAQVAITKDVEAMRSSLMESKVGSRLQLLESQSVRLRSERELKDAGNHLTGLQHALASNRAERSSFMTDWNRQLLEELYRARAEATRVGEGLAKASRVNDMVVLVAPEDAVVLEMAKRSVGSVVREAEPLITLVPSKAPLVAEISIRGQDVGHTPPGSEVVIKVDAFPYQRNGVLKGFLRSISEDSYSPSAQPGEKNGGGSFHRGLVELTSIDLVKLPEGTRLIPGMTVNADILVGRRTVLSFFIYPILQAFQEGIREP